MNERSADALELLLPDAAPAFWQRAQRVTTFLRLLSDDARSHGSASVHVSLPRARNELDRSAADRRIRVHEELLRHHLYALVGADSFAHFGECTGELQQAWSDLEEERTDSCPLAHVPLPGERAEQVAQRLVAGLESVGASVPRVELWRARCERASRGAQAGAAAFERLLSQQGKSRGDVRNSALANFALAGLVECLLDRGAVRAARARLESASARLPADPRLKCLWTWTAALSGEAVNSAGFPASSSQARARLPRSLGELRARLPSVGIWFPGQESSGEPLCPPGVELDGAALEQRADGARKSHGAALFSAWSLVGPGRAQIVASAHAPAHGGRLSAWLTGRDGAASDAREPECQMLGDARARIEHFGALAQCAPARTAIDPQSILALAVVPVSDVDGDLRGWLRLEFEHHLVPSRAALARLAVEWSIHLAPRAGRSLAVIPTQLADEASFAAAVLRDFVEGLSLKTSQRRWSAFDVREGGALLVARGGEGLESSDFSTTPDLASGADSCATSAGRAISRAISTGLPVTISEAERSLALHPAALSGVAIPVGLRGRVLGVWLVESARRGDFSVADLKRFRARADVLAPELAAAQFRTWHLQRFGHDAHVEPASAVAVLGPEQLVALASARGPVAISGPFGSGRRILARRLHFEGPSRAGVLRRLSCAAADFERTLETRGADGGWIVEGLLDQPRDRQARVAQLIEENGDAPGRLYFVLDRSISTAAEDSTLTSELAWLLSRIELRVEPLAKRRAEIAPLARLFAHHFAAHSGLRTPMLEDSALAFLWRQPWPGNVRELAQWMYRLVLCPVDRAVDAGMFMGLAERFGHEALARLPSRHPDKDLLISALKCTATGKGTWNKTRAALYLGWDTDTLQNRILEAGLTCENG